MDYFKRLGAALEHGWTAADRDEERFPDVAALVLDEHRPGKSFDRDAVLDWALDPTHGGGQQLAPATAFAQPGITAFHGEGFVIELYYWIDSASAIHNHPFCGVFTVLEGWSVHARYKTSVASRAGTRGQLLNIYLTDLELLEAGAIERFSLKRHPLIHALIHIPVPSISMVIRTTRTEGYLRYLPPSLAVGMDEPPDPAARRLALVDALVAAGDPRGEAALIDLLARADFETVVRALSTQWPHADLERRQALLDAAAGHGDRIDAIKAALDRSLRIQQATAIRHQHRDPDIRLCATALGYAELRNHVLKLLGRRDGDPIERLHRFVDVALPTEEDEPRRTMAHVMVDGGDTAAALEALEQSYGSRAVETLRPAVEHYCEHSLFSVLSEPPRAR